MRFGDFPGSFIEVNRIVSSGVHDDFFDASMQAGSGVILKFLRNLCKHQLIEVALRKVVMEDYTQGRVKTFVVLREMTRERTGVIFFPKDNRDLRPFLSQDLVYGLESAATPKIIRIFNWIVFIFEPLWAFGYASTALLYLILQRGIVMRRPVVQWWNAGFDLFNHGILWNDLGREFYLRGAGDFSLQKMLLVIRNRLEDGRTRTYFEDNHISYVEVSKLPIPLSFLIQRILVDFWAGLGFLCVVQMFRRHSGPFLKAAAVVIFPNLVRSEVLELSHRTRVFVGRDEYGVVHIIRTMLYDGRGGKTIGFSHGDDCYSMIYNAYQCFHYFCFAGEFYRKLLERNTRFSANTELIGTGIYGLDSTYSIVAKGNLPENYKELKKNRKLIGVFSTNYGEESHSTRQKVFDFYRAVFSLLDKRDDVVLVVRPKSSAQEFSDPEFDTLVRRYESKVIVERNLTSYDILPAIDLAICILACSIGVECITAGIPVFYYDDVQEIRPHPYEQYDGRLVVRSAVELETNVNQFFMGEYVDPAVMERIRGSHGTYFDGKVVDRVWGVAEKALAACGVSPKEKVDSSSVRIDE